MPRPPTFHLVTYGCKVNQYDTQVIREDLLARGWREAADGDPVDVAVVDACTVTETAAREALRRIRQLARRPGARVVAAGCLARTHRDVLETIPGVCLLVPTEAKAGIGDALDTLASRGAGLRTTGGGAALAGTDRCVAEGHRQGTGNREQEPTPWLDGRLSDTFRRGISRFDGHSRAFIKVQDGCDRACSYCIVPRVRGRSRSRPVADAIEEARRLLDAGYRELVLTGVHLGGYGCDLPGRPRLIDLAARLLDIPGRWRLRLSSVEANELRECDLDTIADLAGRRGEARILRYGPVRIPPIEMQGHPKQGVREDVNPITRFELENKSAGTAAAPFDRLEAGGRRPYLCPHLHLPLQSGSAEVLRRMRRPYAPEAFEATVASLRARLPDVAITTDLLAGFPGESEADFEATLALARRLGFGRLHAFAYSPRPGTEAARLPGAVPRPAMQARMRALTALARASAETFHRRFIGRTVEALVEERPDRQTGRPCGYSEHYVRVRFDPGAPRGGLVEAVVVRADAAGAEAAIRGPSPCSR
jgi:threonylcarbamoyladenosine tRNA methylthiotransferase MtaB